ncbi:CDP-alcohol phosphatidyltransferase family protein [Chloroflexota bacterium]
MNRNTVPEFRKKPELQHLQIQLTVYTVFAVLCTLAGAVLIGKTWSSENALRWGVIAGIVLVYQVLFIGRRLRNNHRLDEVVLLPTFGLGNSLTMLRGVLFAWTAGFLFLPRPRSYLAWAPAVLYTTSLALDLGDGYAARMRNHATRLGAALDTEWDALGLLVAVSLAVWYRTLPVWFLPIGAARYAFMFGIWLRNRQGLLVYPLPDSSSRRPIAGLTMGFTSAMLWPIVSPPGSILAGIIFLIPFAASFLRDWLVVSGTLDPQSRGYRRLLSCIRTFLYVWVPLVLRIYLALVVGVKIKQWLDSPTDPYVNSPFPFTLAVLMLALGAAALVLGIGGRFTAFVLIFPLGFAILEVGLQPVLAISLLGTLAILLLGTGKYSLWEPEKKLFGRHWGVR